MKFRELVLMAAVLAVIFVSFAVQASACDGVVSAQIVKAPMYAQASALCEAPVVQQQIVQAAPAYQVQQQIVQAAPVYQAKVFAAPVYASPVVVRQQAVYAAPAYAQQQVVVRQQAVVQKNVYASAAPVVSLNVSKQRRGFSLFRGRSRSVGVAQQAVAGGGGVNINASGRARVRVR